MAAANVGDLGLGQLDASSNSHKPILSPIMRQRGDPANGGMRHASARARLVAVVGIGAFCNASLDFHVPSFLT